MIFADRGLGLAREQHLFIGGVLICSVSVLYFPYQQVLRRVPRLVKKALAVVTVESAIVMFLLLFSSGTIPWPTSMLPYGAGTIVITPVTIIRADWVFRRDAERPC